MWVRAVQLSEGAGMGRMGSGGTGRAPAMEVNFSKCDALQARFTT